MNTQLNPDDFEAIDYEVDDPTWREHLGTSHAATFFNEHPFETAAEYWLIKAGLADRPPETEQMRRGKHLESAIVTWWTAETDNLSDVFQPRPMTRGPLASLPDRIVGDEILSIKTAPYSYDEIERYWWWQAQGEMVVFNMDAVRIVWLDRRQLLQEHVVKRDVDAGITLFNRASEFAQSISNNPDDMPDWVQESHTADTIITAYPNPKGWVEATPELASLLADYNRLAAEGREYDKAKRAIRDDIAKMIGDHEVVRVGGVDVATFKATAGRTSFDTKRFQAEHQSLYNSYVTKGEPTRSLRFVKKGADALDQF